MSKQNDLLMDISILYRSTQKYYDKKLADLSLTYAQLPILISIYEDEGISMQQIAQDGGYDKGTITKNVQKLASLGYVEVQSSLKDKRVKELYTTDNTKQVMNRIYGIRRNWWKHIIHSLPLEKVEEFSSFYEEMAENAKAYAEKEETEIQIFSHKKVDLLTYSNKISTTFSTAGCNFRCPFCQKRDLIFLNENRIELDIEQIKEYLNKRSNVLDAVCFDGPEVLMHPELEPLLRYIKDLGYVIKIRTNGSYPELLKRWVAYRLVDFVSLDIMNSRFAYSSTIGVSNFDLSLIDETLELLRSQVVRHEVVLTLIQEIHTLQDVQDVASWVQGVQSFVLRSFVGDEHFHGFDREQMKKSLEIAKAILPNTSYKENVYDTSRKAR